MSERVRIALIQMKSAGGTAANLEKAAGQCREAARGGARIICLQELFRSDYFPQSENSGHFNLAETIPGPATETLSAIAREEEVVIVAPLFERRAEGLYHNTAVVIDADGSLTGKYRKMHIPDDPCFYEKYYFTPGDLGFKTFATRYGKIAVLICWDQWFPEAARLAALEGAQLLFYPTAIGWHDSETEAAREVQQQGWQIIQRAHAVANGIFVAAVNRTGREGELTFWGRSFVSDPFGTVMAEAGAEAEEILYADCDLEQIETQRRNWPFLRDRRIDAYGGLTSRYLDA